MSRENPFANTPATLAENNEEVVAEGEKKFSPDPEDINREAMRIWEAAFEDLGEDDPKYRSPEQVADAVRTAVEQYGWPDDTKTIETMLRTPVARAYQLAITQ